MEQSPHHRVQSSRLLPPTPAMRATIWWAHPPDPVRPLKSGLEKHQSVRVSPL